MALKWVLLFMKLTCAIEFTHNDNGWKPLPVEIALFHTNAVSRSFKDPAFETLITRDDVEVAQPQFMDIAPRPKSLNVDKQESKLITNSNRDKNNEKFGDKHGKSEFREPKQLIMKETSLPPTEDKTAKIETKYEVTEKLESLDQVNAEEKNTYIYEVPKNQLTTPEQNVSKSLTTKFLDILKKNNFNLKNYEVNYAISRSKITNSKNQDRNILVMVPIQIPLRYNTHIPPDAILAMILSNYGLYLPGMNGNSGKYNNAYGYLQSNNIHHIKPFGLYKVFSDTDSSF